MLNSGHRIAFFGMKSTLRSSYNPLRSVRIHTLKWVCCIFGLLYILTEFRERNLGKGTDDQLNCLLKKKTTNLSVDSYSSL